MSIHIQNIMSEGGFTESLGMMIFVGILIILAGVVLTYSLNMANDNTQADYTPIYVYTNTEIVPALSKADTWDANSIKIFFTEGKRSDINYNNIKYAGTEDMRFLLYDPKGDQHEAIQSVSMKGLEINPGATFYYYTLSDNLSDPYYITNQYARIGDDSNWGTEWSYPKRLEKGTWRVVVINERSKTIIAKTKVENS